LKSGEGSVMVHVKYDRGLVFKGRYNRKRKEISINPRNATFLSRLYVLFHENLHYLFHRMGFPRVLDKLLDYIAYGHKYFSSFQEYQKCRKYDVLFRIVDREFDKLGLELFEIRDGKVVFVSRKGLSEREFKEVRRRFGYVWEGIRLLEERLRKEKKKT